MQIPSRPLYLVLSGGNMEIEIIGKCSALGMCLNMTNRNTSHLSCRDQCRCCLITRQAALGCLKRDARLQTQHLLGVTFFTSQYSPRLLSLLLSCFHFYILCDHSQHRQQRNLTTQDGITFCKKWVLRAVKDSDVKLT